MWTPRHARWLPALSALISSFGGDKQYGKAGPGTFGAFAGAIRPRPAC